MKTGIHPTYSEALVTCSCGNTFTTRSTKGNLKTDLCSVCHPFYTGEQRIVDSAGQVERFMKRMQAASESGARPSKRQQRLATRSAETEARDRDAEETRAEDDAVVATPPAAMPEAARPTA